MVGNSCRGGGCGCERCKAMTLRGRKRDSMGRLLPKGSTGGAKKRGAKKGGAKRKSAALGGLARVKRAKGSGGLAARVSRLENNQQTLGKALLTIAHRTAKLEHAVVQIGSALSARFGMGAGAAVKQLGSGR